MSISTVFSGTDYVSVIIGAHFESLSPKFDLIADLYRPLLLDQSVTLGPWRLVSNLSHCLVIPPKSISLHFFNCFSEVLKIYNIVAV